MAFCKKSITHSKCGWVCIRFWHGLFFLKRFSFKYFLNSWAYFLVSTPKWSSYLSFIWQLLTNLMFDFYLKLSVFMPFYKFQFHEKHNNLRSSIHVTLSFVVFFSFKFFIIYLIIFICCNPYDVFSAMLWISSICCLLVFLKARQKTSWFLIQPSFQI